MKATNRKQQTERLRRNEEKWTPTLMEAGWTVIPSIILERQRGLGLDAIDVNILMQLAMHWWFSDNPPRPSKRTIAERMGIDVSTVRKRIARMEGDGLIRREKRYSGKTGRQESNNYHFDGLIASATPYAQEALETRKKRDAEDAERRTRRRAHLSLVTNDEGDAE
ncbi:MAG TPA: winged helix-turn-helix transcriptional regulator [Thermoanaerobaculia bacterium]|nr:winged helix-turn-helix transcriptional regulator [Thermoanaerobaculia bacterium]